MGAPAIIWPGMLAEVAAIGGDGAALRLMAARGGTIIYWPKRADPDHWLVPLIGMQALVELAASRGGERIEIPLGAAANRLKVAAIIAQALAEGKSAPEAARLAGVHARTVRRHRNRAIDERQGRLF